MKLEVLHCMTMAYPRVQVCCIAMGVAEQHTAATGYTGRPAYRDIAAPMCRRTMQSSARPHTRPLESFRYFAAMHAVLLA